MIKKLFILFLIAFAFFVLIFEASARQRPLEYRAIEFFNLSEQITPTQMRQILRLPNNRELIEKKAKQYEFGKNWHKPIPLPEIKPKQIVGGAILEAPLPIPATGILDTLTKITQVGVQSKKDLVDEYLSYRKNKGGSEQKAWQRFLRERFIILELGGDVKLLGNRFADIVGIDMDKIVTNPNGKHALAVRAYFSFVWESIEMAEQRGRWTEKRNWLLVESKRIANLPPEKTISQRIEEMIISVTQNTWSKVQNVSEQIWDIVQRINPFDAGIVRRPHITNTSLEQSLLEINVIKERIRKEIRRETEQEMRQELEEELETTLAQTQEMEERISELLKQIDALNKEVEKAKAQAIEKETEGTITEAKEETDEKEKLEEDTQEETDRQQNERVITCLKNSIDINSALKQELEKIIEVGPTIADNIIKMRPFSSLDELLRVPRIGPITLQQIKNQGCAFVVIRSGGGGNFSSTPAPTPTPSEPSLLKPQITLSYLSENQVNNEIKVTLFTENFKNATYDVKISILEISQGSEQSRTLSEIYNPNINNWQSSFRYVTSTFSGTSFSGDFRLRIHQDKNNFRGQADIIVRIREAGKSAIYARFDGRITIVNPENQPPIAQFTFSPPNPTIYEEITLNASSSTDSDGAITSFIWNFGDGNTTTTASPTTTYRYVTSTDFLIQLTLIDNLGATSTTSTLIKISPPLFSQVHILPSAERIILPVQGKTQLSVQILNSQGQGMIVPADWSTQDTNLGTINSAGIFTAQSTGTTNVTASIGTINRSQNISIQEALRYATGTAPQKEWSWIYQKGLWSKAHSARQTRDGGFIIAGYIKTPSAIWLIRTDAYGNKKWNRLFTTFDDQSFHQQAHFIKETNDNGFILAGQRTLISGRSAMSLIKTDSEGNVEWERSFGPGVGANVMAFSVQETSNNDFILVGDISTHLSGSAKLVKVSATGTYKWSRTFNGKNATWTWARSVQQTTNGDFIIAGWIDPSGVGAQGDFWLLKTNSGGEKIWEKTFGATTTIDKAYSVQQTRDGGFMIAGTTDLFLSGEQRGDFWLIKTDSRGEKEWDRIFNGGHLDWLSSAQQTKEGGFILAGRIDSLGTGDSDFWLVKTDESGNKEWSKILGGPGGGDRVYSVQQTQDGGFILAGQTNSFGQIFGPGLNNYNLWLVKIKK